MRVTFIIPETKPQRTTQKEPRVREYRPKHLDEKKFRGPYKELLSQMHMVWDELDRINDFFDGSVFNNINYITNFNDELVRVLKWKKRADHDVEKLKAQMKEYIDNRDSTKDSI